MPGLDDFLDMLPHTVTYEKVSAVDEYGRASTYEAAVTYKARVSWKNVRVVNRFTGQEEVAGAEVWINGDLIELHQDDKITLPDGSIPRIVSWNIIGDEKDRRHTKVFFGTSRNA